MAMNLNPMSETAYYILLSLLEERHGYGIMQHVEQITDNRIKIGAGTIYGTLGKLEKAGLILSTKEEEKRKYYQITEEGKTILRQEVLRLRELYENGKGLL
ncbi:transcriptional regulator, PadR family [Lachnospiraceae bacterium KM106-2]|nr:transcriptional regulator, PadR family [Lachnospiraceae bacterium KM106-2]